MADRKLATVRKIATVSDIPGKDRIALATVDGWSVIIQKADFKPGDLCVFMEPDSVLPDAPWCSFLKDHRIRTMKMAGCLSQGIAFPLSIMENYGDLIVGIGAPDDNSIVGFYNGKKAVYFEVGLDLTDVIGVKKWERPDAEDVGDIKPVRSYKKYPKFLMRFKWFRDTFVYRNHGLASARAFPEFLTKTDEIRIQNCPWVLDKDDTWVLTEKVDGSSGSFCIRKEKHGFFRREKLEFYVCSRNRRLFNDDGSSYWKVANRYNLKSVLTSILKEQDLEWVAIQGEVIGPKVQGNKYKLTEPDLYVFNFITSKQGRWASADGKRLMESYGINWVPIVGVGMLPETVEGMLSIAHGQSQICDILREGLVCRSLDGKQSFKAVDPEFLIHWGE